jgi:hypothetical protein
LENAVSQLADSPETIPLEAKELASMNPGQLLELELYPRMALALYEFEYPINAYYAAVIANKASGKPVRNTSYSVIFRHDDVVWRMDLESDEYQLLSKVFDGVKIGRALENFSEETVSKFPGWFSRWVRNGLLAKTKKGGDDEATHSKWPSVTRSSKRRVSAL